MRRLLPRIVFLAALCGATPASAQPGLIPASGVLGKCNIYNGTMDFDCIPLFVANIIQFLFAAIGTFSVVMIIIGGYQVILGGVTGGGSDKGKATIKHAIIGLVVSTLAFALINFVITLIT